jgi:hypothetical protein
VSGSNRSLDCCFSSCTLPSPGVRFGIGLVSSRTRSALSATQSCISLSARPSCAAVCKWACKRDRSSSPINRVRLQNLPSALVPVGHVTVHPTPAPCRTAHVSATAAALGRWPRATSRKVRILEQHESPLTRTIVAFRTQGITSIDAVIRCASGCQSAPSVG